jgi:hypothetical protein
MSIRSKIEKLSSKVVDLVDNFLRPNSIYFKTIFKTNEFYELTQNSTHIYHRAEQPKSGYSINRVISEQMVFSVLNGGVGIPLFVCSSVVD